MAHAETRIVPMLDRDAADAAALDPADEADVRCELRLRHAAAAGAAALDERLAALDREWDTDRAVEVDAAVTGLVGLALAVLTGRRRWLVLPAIAATAALTHARTGHHPLMPVFRRLGLRPARRIERERYAAKALRGDFAALQPAPAADPGGSASAAPPRDALQAYAAVAGGTAGGAAAETDALPPTAERVACHTPDAVNDAIRERTEARVLRFEGADGAAIDARLRALDAELGIERALQTNASILVLAGTVLGATGARRWLLLPAAVLSFFAQHALQGWCPPLPVMRRLGIRTVREIEQERHALKALRGDYDAVATAGDGAGAAERVRAALAAVDA